MFDLAKNSEHSLAEIRIGLKLYMNVGLFRLRKYSTINKETVRKRGTLEIQLNRFEIIVY